MGFYLSKHEFHDGVAVRYNANLNNVPPRCEATACGASYTLGHALTCKHGGNRILRHDMVVRAVHSLARTALGSGPTRVVLEPWLVKQGAVGPDGRVCREGLRADLLLTGLDEYRPRSYLDVRIPYPDADGYVGTSVERLLENHEAEKVTRYKAACENHQYQSGEFVPFVATTDGVLGRGAQKVLSQLVERLCTKWEHKSKGEIMAWVRARIAVAIVRAASACIRGQRRKPGPEDGEVGFVDAAALGPLLNGGSPAA